MELSNLPFEELISQVVNYENQIRVLQSTFLWKVSRLIRRVTGYDLAVLQINRGNLAALNLGDSTKLVVGESVMAVGYLA